LDNINIRPNLDDKLIDIGEDRFYVLGMVLVENCGYTTEELKNMWGLADTILRNDKVYYICMKLIDVEIQN
jgi:hypothetical protein|tara:strand:+ start:432 stop:644 length:213 start_codon:yes stop_codon:yes gene_type:complete